MNFTGVSVFPTDSDGSQFWALVSWCHERGAADFSVFVEGTNGYALAAQAKGRLNERLAPFALGVERRICPDYFSWDEAETMVWSLNGESLHALRDIDIEVPKGYRKPTTSSSSDETTEVVAPKPQLSPGVGTFVTVSTTVGEPYMEPESYQMYLCIYKGGIPMLVVICEQYNELLLVLTDDDLVSFEQLCIDALCDFIPEYDVVP